tara:strand:- start:15424 stop:16275 length:852 start_codon:yes stop_codon:yes gene_type:complete
VIQIKINPTCAWGGQSEVERYAACIQERREKYPVDIGDTYKHAAEEVNLNGYSSIKGFIDPIRLAAVKEEFELIKSRGELQYNDFYTEQVAHPLLTCDSVFNVAFDDEVVEIAKSYFNCLPAINNVQLRKSKATTISESNIPGNGQTTLFHCDKDSPRLLKFFFYLNDVTDANGPFTYVHGSHLQKFNGWNSKYRWTHNDIESIYGKDRIIRCKGDVGDVILGNTNGFHKGTKVEQGERTILTVYYGIHPTEWRETFGGRMKLSDFESLPEHKRPLADYLNKV